MAKAKKLKSGNYRVLVPDFKDEKGKWHYKSFTAKTKKEAEYMAMEFSHNRQRSSASYDDLTLKEAYERYIGISKVCQVRQQLGVMSNTKINICNCLCR